MDGLEAGEDGRGGEEKERSVGGEAVGEGRAREKRSGEEKRGEGGQGGKWPQRCQTRLVEPRDRVTFLTQFTWCLHFV